jgi:IclR family transcriptional regulator, KDG regulon repressor
MPSALTGKHAGGGAAKAGPASEEGRRYRVPAAARVLALIEFLAAARTPMGISETARQMGIPKSSCFALMTTLEQAGYVRRDERDEWTLTLRIYHVGVSAAKSVDIQVAAQPVLRDLCEVTGLTSHLGLFDGSSIIYALKVDPPGGMVKFDTYPGKRASPHLTAIGRAIASTMSKAEIAALLDGYHFTGGDNPKIRSRSALTSELRVIRERGYAVEMEEETLGVGCIAAPVIHAGSAAIGVAALAGQIKDKSVETISAAVIGAAKSLSAALGEHEPTG